MFRCRPRGVAADALLDCLQRVSAAPKDRYPNNTRYALLLALGEFSIEEIPESRRVALLEQLADWYRHDPSSGVHGAAGWLLRQWGQAEVVRQVDHTAVPYAPDREWFTLAITVTPTAPPKPKTEPAKENAGSRPEPPKPAESRPSKPEATAKPAASSKSAGASRKGQTRTTRRAAADQDVLLHVYLYFRRAPTTSDRSMTNRTGIKTKSGTASR